MSVAASCPGENFVCFHADLRSPQVPVELFALGATMKRYWRHLLARLHKCGSWRGAVIRERVPHPLFHITSNSDGVGQTVEKELLA